jgi:hypothetical protein
MESARHHGGVGGGAEMRTTAGESVPVAAATDRPTSPPQDQKHQADNEKDPADRGDEAGHGE